jgi:hypothetical protein
LLAGVFVDEGIELVLEEHEAERILHRLHVRARADALLSHDEIDERDDIFLVAALSQDLGGAGGVELAELCAPAQVPDPTLREVAPRNFPALDVLAVRRAEDRRVVSGK